MGSIILVKHDSCFTLKSQFKPNSTIFSLSLIKNYHPGFSKKKKEKENYHPGFSKKKKEKRKKELPSRSPSVDLKTHFYKLIVVGLDSNPITFWAIG